MKQIKHILIEHDVYIFQISKQAIDKGNDLIGFYFDFLGFPQRILKKSVYGQIVFQKLGLSYENNVSKSALEEAEEEYIAYKEGKNCFVAEIVMDKMYLAIQELKSEIARLKG